MLPRLVHIVCALTLVLSGVAAAQEKKVMRYVRAEHQGKVFYGLLEGETVHELWGDLFAPPERDRPHGRRC